MSCECEKLRDLYDRLVDDRMVVLSQVYGNAIGNGSDISPSQMLKPNYEAESGSPGVEYGSPEKQEYGSPRGGMLYDIAPARMPVASRNYQRQTQNEMPNELEIQADRLAEMIANARGEGEKEWMSTMQ